jgi:hypothetical protein
MPRLRDQIDPLVEAAKLDSKPTLVEAFHIGCDDASSNDLAGVAVGPRDTERPRSYSRSHGALPNESVDVELEPLLKAGPLTGSRHERRTKNSCEWIFG